VRYACLLVVLLVAPRLAKAIEEIHTEENVADLLAEPPPSPEEMKGRQWAILPQVGYGPDTGAVGGIKLTHRHLGGAGITLDVDATYALKQQQDFEVELATPHLLDDHFLTLVRFRYYYDPKQEFFGLGNNDVGPDPASTQSFEQYQGEFTFGWRPWRRLAINLTAAVSHVRIGHGDMENNPPRPFTLDAFPNLTGVDGGFVNPLSLSLVYTTRDEVLEPTRGWRAILKVAHTNRAFGSDFQFTRVDGDVGYCWTFWHWRGDHVLGARLNGGVITGPQSDVPFWELERLGGDDTLRGFFPRRFLGTERGFLNLEYRFPIWEFGFLHLWHIRVRGAVFGEGGRVFESTSTVQRELGTPLVNALVSNFQYSGGAGIRFAVAQAILARIDVGFSDEEKGLIYLSFGQAF
jgi:outer membrane protein assembly factor BamA